MLAYLALALVLGLGSALLLDRVGFGTAYNADQVLAYMVARDVLPHPADLASWYLSPANYAFPDLSAAGFLTLVRIPLTTMPIVYGGLLLAGLASAAAFLVRQAGGQSLLNAMAVFGVVLLLLVSIGAATVAVPGGGLTCALTVIMYHTGALTIGMLTLALGLRIAFGPGSGRPAYAVMLILAVLTGFSDVLYIIWFVVPIVAVWPWALAKRRWGRPAGLLAAALGGALADRILRWGNSYGAPDYPASLHVWISTVLGAAGRGDWLILAPSLLSLLMIGHAATIIVSRRGSKSISRFEMASLVMTGSTVIAFTLPLAAGLLRDSASLRYGLPLFFVPYIWVVTVILRVAPARIVTGVGVASALPLAVVAGVFALPSVAAAEHMAAPSATASCLMNMGLSDGISDYWGAKSTIFSSDYRLSLVQVIGDGGRYPWNTTSRWFTEKADGSGPVRPTFILIDDLDAAGISKRFGAPSRVANCDWQFVWLYDHPLPPPTD